jgi:hypothetical protein
MVLIFCEIISGAPDLGSNESLRPETALDMVAHLQGRSSCWIERQELCFLPDHEGCGQVPS